MRNLRTEDEIIANWKGDIDKPVVSICCITYNHEPYIEDALEGFLIQETDFPFEILIHDDASTDRTADIIREYEAKYPRLIKPIYQTENQYSINVNLPFKNTWDAAKGEYIAMCEGDDYWTASKKLQIQHDNMKNNPSCFMCFHPALQVSESQQPHVRNRYKDGTVFRLDEIVKKGGGFYPTASSFFRAVIVKKIPSWFWLHPTGDFPLAVLASTCGNICYLDKVMSVYRSHATSVTHNKEAREFGSVMKKAKSHILFLEEVGRQTDISNTSISKAIAGEFYSALSKAVKIGRFREAFMDLGSNQASLTLMQQVKLVLKIFLNYDTHANLKTFLKKDIR